MHLILLLMGILLSTVALGQPSKRHTVFFDPGKASISLQQLDSIKMIAAELQGLPSNRLLVYAFADDAEGGASNLRLSRQRAFLMQQCFERAGIGLEMMHIENKIRRQRDINACEACAEILITSDTNFFNKEIHHQQIANYMQSFSEVETQAYTIDADTDELIVTPEGLLLFIPAGTLKAEGTVDLEINNIQSTWDRLLFQLDTRSHQQQFLASETNVFIGAKQNNQVVEMRNNRSITIVLPANEYLDEPRVYQHEGANWFSYPQQTAVQPGSFYGEGYCAAPSASVQAPIYSSPPQKPSYKSLEDATLFQDGQLTEIAAKLARYEAMKIDEKGKVVVLNAQLRTKEAALKTKKNRLMFAKEKILMSVRDQNQLLEDDYLKSLALYNKQRNRLQRAYLSRLDSVGGDVKLRQQRCAKQIEYFNALKASYPQHIFEQISAALRNNTPSYRLGYWTEIHQLGWMCVAKVQSKTPEQLVPFRVLSTSSAYQVSAFLVFDNQSIVVGEAIDESDIVFWEVPEGKSATLIAISKNKSGFQVAHQKVETNGLPITIEYRYKNLSSLLPKIR